MKIRYGILLASLCVTLVIATGCKDDYDLQYNFIPANLSPDKTDVTFSSNAKIKDEKIVVMTGAAKGSTWFVRKEGSFISVVRTTDRIIISVTEDNKGGSLRSGKIILSEEAAGGLVVDKSTITVTQVGVK